MSQLTAKRGANSPLQLDIYFSFVQTTPPLTAHIRGKVMVRLAVGGSGSIAYSSGIRVSKQAWDNRLKPTSPEGKAVRKQLQTVLSKLQTVWSGFSTRKSFVSFDAVIQQAGLFGAREGVCHV